MNNSNNEKLISFLKQIHYKGISKTGNFVLKKFNGRSILSFLNKDKEQKKVHSKFNDNFLNQKEDSNSNTEAQIIKLFNRNKPILKRKKKSLYDKIIEERDKEIEELQNSIKENFTASNIKYGSSIINENNNNHKLYDTKTECLQSFKENRKRFIINESYLNVIKETRSRIPPSSKYNPNYNSIRKHIPTTIFKNKLNRSKIQTTTYTDKFFDSSDIIDSKNVMKFENYSSRDFLNFVNKDILKSNSTFLTFLKSDKIKEKTKKKTIHPIKKLTKIISVPDFKKMTSRAEKPHSNFHQLPRIFSYNPNYNYFFNSNYSSISPKLKKKMYQLKKCICEYNPKLEYKIIPSLNII